MNKINVRMAIKHDQQLTDLVMEYVAITKRLFNEANQSGSTADGWAPLATMVAVDQFKWVSPSYEELSWPEYVTFLNEWARSVSWETTVMRIHQWQNLVYLEHVERCTFGDTVEVGSSVAVYEFNEFDKIQRLSVYLQHKPSLGL